MSGLRIIRCSSEIMANILLGGIIPYTSNLPVDLVVVGLIQSDLTKPVREIDLICRSDDWDTAMDAAIPIFNAIFTTHNTPVEVTETTHTVETVRSEVGWL